MNEKEINRQLFLAIPDEIYNNFFQDEDIKAICDHFKVELIVFNIEDKTIVEWVRK